MCVCMCVDVCESMYLYYILTVNYTFVYSDRETNMWKGIVYGRQLGPMVQMSPGNNTPGSDIYSTKRKHIKLRTNRPTRNRIGNRISRDGIYDYARTRNSDKSALYIILDYRLKLFYNSCFPLCTCMWQIGTFTIFPSNCIVSLFYSIVRFYFYFFWGGHLLTIKKLPLLKLIEVTEYLPSTF